MTGRRTLLALWAACLLIMPVLLVAMFFQAIAGSTERAMSMAVAFDESGNALFGGDPRQTISARVGKALVAGEPWAKYVAPVIDFFFGEGHCLAHAND